MVLEVKQLQMDYNMCKCVCIFSAVKAMPQHLQELTTKSTLEGLTYIKKNITDVNEEMILHLKKLHMTPSFVFYTWIDISLHTELYCSAFSTLQLIHCSG